MLVEVTGEDSVMADQYAEVTASFGDDKRWFCAWCQCDLAEYADGWRSEGNGETACSDRNGEPHRPVQPPLSWCNWASVEPRPDQDSVSVHISVGDRRSGFTMTVRRTEDGGFIIATPHPEDGFLHLPLENVKKGLHRVVQP